MTELNTKSRDEVRPEPTDMTPPDVATPDPRAARDLDHELDTALRRARRDAADRAQEQTPAGRRVGERARLEHLLAALAPILRRLPKDAEMFDVGVTQGFDRDGAEGRPRLFLDMIGFVECAPGGGFRLVQSTRHGRVNIGEASDLAGARRLVADYFARRIVEREQALASDRTVEDAALRLIRREPGEAPAPPRVDRTLPDAIRPDPARVARVEPRGAAPRAALDPDDDAPRPVRQRPARPTLRDRLAATRARLPSWPSWPRWRRGARLESTRLNRGGAIERGLVFAVQFLGSAALTLIVAMAAWWAWKAAGFVK